MLTLAADVTDDTQLKEVIDYGSFPSWDSSSCPPVYSRLRIGSATNVSDSTAYIDRN